ncbi:TetR/AcrR family transcriptional regulator [Vibrio sp. TH_r3]|uniref:TetR/AcrR family transcriptional regulator n=1 Tax=Vibrio sp. TH_r3 TaxID=3082084 RepID=UPI0029553099|nr:TetR/AcrR family transcriptional regulator [Vibrio sp. TH_r3]MDV7103438.1 TetR/AcrR family transcriptional regulator [Vibrio sp. TH_r3]
MPKKSKAETKITVQRILDAVADQLLRLGYDRMSYTTLSQQTGISRTGISHHFPKKKDFMVALDNRIYKKFISYLSLDGQLDQFSTSWQQSLSRPEFSSILRILFHHLLDKDKGDKMAKGGVKRLYKLLKRKYGEQSERELEWLIGRSLSNISDK